MANFMKNIFLSEEIALELLARFYPSMKDIGYVSKGSHKFFTGIGCTLAVGIGKVGDQYIPDPEHRYVIVQNDGWAHGNPETEKLYQLLLKQIMEVSIC